MRQTQAERWGERLELVGMTLTVLLLAAIFGSFIGVGIWLWVYGAWWIGLAALVPPVGWLAWLGWDWLR